MNNSEETKRIFENIYLCKGWGSSGDPQDRFFSGSGTRTQEIAGPYISAVTFFLDGFKMIMGRPADVVDLGCGDFFIGSKLRPHCGRYVACDIVPSLIEFNRDKFRKDNVEFLALDFTEDELPAADVVFVRQVFQHLENSQINKALNNISTRYDYLLLTEHLPSEFDFMPNHDIPSVGSWRVPNSSGVVVTAPPFNLKVRSSLRLVESKLKLGRVVTTLYKL
jgi:hypothetical protein